MIGLVGIRRALALAVLAFFGTIYLLTAVAVDGPWARPFAGLAACYGLAFFAAAAGWFWGRWFASGLGWSGVMLALFALVMIGISPQLIWYGALHLVVVLALMGKPMAEGYEGQNAWRERYQLGEPAAQRLGRAVVRAGASLPSLILWALAPREEGMAATLVLAVAILGGAALLRARAWGALALGGAAVATLVMGGLAVPGPALVGAGHVPWYAAMATAGSVVAVPALLVLAFLPFAGPVARFLIDER
jgi:hypothetical protein